jgi:hypothetical protein
MLGKAAVCMNAPSGSVQLTSNVGSSDPAQVVTFTNSGSAAPTSWGEDCACTWMQGRYKIAGAYIAD